MKDWDLSEIRRALAPSGGLRTTINCGNPILARHEQTTREVSGMSVDLARKLAEEISVPLDLVVVESAGKAVAAVERGDADVGFFARDPDRAGLIAFTEPYVLIEGCYLVREGASISTIDQVDETGNRIMVGKGSAYDLFLSRHIVHATVERVPTSPAVVQAFLDAGQALLPARVSSLRKMRPPSEALGSFPAGLW
ncbi:transporter substrate-binding domain-containing protein [Agrobacterium bohemicum]|uniref:transporter substrate-binding domain-containing protein n=1 Tax=Agrobacterium bohemicum TaxID=2052828 RepID=UPI000B276B66|nr:transporter substrate-binding domain-containing protein [Agrobacterium bohemicum]